MSGQTLVEKIVTRHAAAGTPRPVRAHDVVMLRPRHVLTHDNGTAVLQHFRRMGMKQLRYPWQPLLVLDHDIQDPDEARLARWSELGGFAREHRLEFRGAGTGIGHELMVGEGFVVPGAVCVAADSHANMYGALGALGTAITRSDAAAVWATGEFWWEVPPSVRVVLHGRLRDGVTAKDLALSLIARFGSGEVHDRALEFSGDGITSLDVDARLTLANLSTEWGAVAGIFPVDARTLSWLEHVRRENAKRGVRRFGRAQLLEWADAPLAPDDDAPWVARIEVDLDSVDPVVTGPDAPGAMVGTQRTIAVDKAFLVGCANARLSDLQAAARVLSGGKVHERVRFYVAAASREVQDAAVRTGVWEILVRAGARTLPPGCAMCIGLGEGVLEPGEVAVSATNRNFPGRMGSTAGEAWLASPAAVARAALTGELRLRPPRPLSCRYEEFGPRPGVAPAGGSAPAGLPAPLSGRALFVPADDLDTDRIFPSTGLYRPVDAAGMASMLLQNHDPSFAAQVRPGDLVIGGFRFGAGSSREQAVAAFAAAGVRAIVVGSAARSFRRNAANLALPCLECPALVRALQADHAGGPARTVVLSTPVEVDLAAGTIHALGLDFPFSAPPPVVLDLLASGGLVERVRRRFSIPGGAA